MTYQPTKAARPTVAGQNPLARPLTPGEYGQLSRVAMARASWLLRDHSTALETQIRQERERLAAEWETLTAGHAELAAEIAEVRKDTNRVQQRLATVVKRRATYEEEIRLMRQRLESLDAERELLSRALGERTEEVTRLRTAVGPVAGREGLELATREATRVSRSRHGLGRKHRNAA